MLERIAEIGKTDSRSRTVRMILAGANSEAAMSGAEIISGKANYLIGNDPTEWRSGIPLFAKVRANEIYPGIDVIYHAGQSARLEYDFVVKPGASAKRISLRIDGADDVRVDASGDLILKIGGAEVRQHKPVIYQEINGSRREIRGRYQIVNENKGARNSRSMTVGFRIGDYDSALPLIIDPTLSFSTFFGGTRADRGWAIALDSSGNIYIAGETVSKNKFPVTPGAVQRKFAGGIAGFGDAFVAKFDAVSNQLVYVTYLGGKTDDGAFALAVDAAGNAFITGFTDSRNFPIVPANGALRSKVVGVRNNSFRLAPTDAFVAQLDPTGSSLVFSTLLGGTRRDAGYGIAVDASGVYVTGLTESTNFIPVPNGFQPFSGGRQDAFVAKIIGGTNYAYCTYLGGTNMEQAKSIAVDSAGNAYVTGWTSSTNFPIVNPITLVNDVYTNGITLDHLNLQTRPTGRPDAFISKISADGMSLLYSTYLGGSNDDRGTSIALDSAANAYVTGFTLSKVFPTNVVTLPQSKTGNFVSHVFVAKVDSNDNLVYSTQFGGRRLDRGLGIAADAAGLAYVTGFTREKNFFATNAFTDLRSKKVIKAGSRSKDVFLAVLSADGTSFVGTNSLLLGGRLSDHATGIVVDPAGTTAYIVGTTISPDFPKTNSVQSRLDREKNGKTPDAFVSKILFP
jgi:hypothetical protein